MLAAIQIGLSKVIVFRLTEAAIKILDEYGEACTNAIDVTVRTRLFTEISKAAKG